MPSDDLSLLKHSFKSTHILFLRGHFTASWSNFGAEDQLTPLTVETLKKDGLGKLFHVLVAENQKGETKQLIGFLFFHYIYSTWQARAILLTDVYVSPEFSKKSVAKELFILFCKIANEEGCARLQWEVKENDREKIDFVSISSAQNLSAEEGWHKYCFSKEQLLAFGKRLFRNFQKIIILSSR